MDTVIKVIKDFAEELNSRAKSRWLTCFLMSWLIYNWKRLVVLIFTDNRSVELVQNTISDMICLGSLDWWVIARGYGFILLLTAFWIYGRPLIDSLFDSTQHWVKRKLNIDARATIMKRENMNTYDYLMKQREYDEITQKRINGLEAALATAKAECAKALIEYKADHIVEVNMGTLLEHVQDILAEGIVYQEIDSRNKPKASIETQLDRNKLDQALIALSEISIRYKTQAFHLNPKITKAPESKSPKP